MKSKIIRGRGFRGVLDYILNAEKKPALIGGTMSGEKPRDLAVEFSLTRRLRPDIEKPVWHSSLALPAGERLDSARWDEIAWDYLEGLGMDPDRHQWVAVRHSDTEHDHVHIIASRIGLDGSLYLGRNEHLKATRLTQALEKKHGLTLTRGPELDKDGLTVMPDKRKPTGAEIQMGARTGEEPPRIALQRIIDQVLAGGPISAPAFVERLAEVGVTARANVVSTGRMNGFGFELGGIYFKGSQLGDSYKWKGLQKRGVTYEQDRDSDELRRQIRARDTENRGDADATRDGSGNAIGRENGPGSVRQSDGGATAEPRRDVRSGGGGGDPDHRAEDGNNQRSDGANQGRGRGDGKAAAGAGGDSRPAESRGHGEGRGIEAPVVGAGAHVDAGGDDRRRDRHDSRGIRDAAVDASGSARAGGVAGGLATRDRARARVDEVDRVAAKAIDPTGYLESQGYTVERDGQGGRHMSVKDGKEEVFRLTWRDNRWLWTPKIPMKGRGGDTISLVREIEGCGYADAVYRLIGEPGVAPKPRPSRPIPPRRPPYLAPATAGDREAGRAYLRGRGISAEVLDAAEASGMLAYAPGEVLFVGRDGEGTAQAIYRRSTTPAGTKGKRDRYGTDKSFPPILPGDPARVLIVEGGVDALAAHELAARKHEQPPTVIVSGGAVVLKCFDRPEVQGMLKRAERITVAFDHEKDPETQGKADAGHMRQIDRLAEITGRQVQRWDPPKGVKDLAEWIENKRRNGRGGIER
ncbi:MAG: relaxase/mobilization nuclease domain-containing protein [Halothiobacillaceae bacterium]